MLRWFRAFLPREDRFFELFARHAQTVMQGALALQDMLRGGDETPVFCQRVNQFENDADNITREVLTAVRRTFITPFDRGDIKNLITAMDDAIDQMQQTAKAVILFEVRIFEPPMREMGTLLVECANLVSRALPLLQSIGSNVAMLTAITEELTKLEGRVDDLHDIGLKELFLKHRSATTMDCTTPPTRSRRSSRPGCCGRTTRCSGRRSSTSSRFWCSGLMSRKPSAPGSSSRASSMRRSSSRR